jgi:hypothetical protein
MSRVDCQLLDERLMDYLYEELDTREMDEMRAHVEGCPRCAAEIGRFRGVRRAVAQLEMAEPPPAVSAKLLHQAARVQKTPVWRRSRAMRVAVYATPIVAMAAAFMLLIHVKDKALSPAIHPDDVSVTIDGRSAARPAAAPAPTVTVPPGEHEIKAEERAPATLAEKGEKLGDESGIATPRADDKAKGKADIASRVTATEKAPPAEERPARSAVDRKVEFKPPVTKDTTLGKATHATADQPSAHRGAGVTTGAPAGPRGGAPAMHAAPTSGGEDFDAVMGGAMSGRRDIGGGGKTGGDVRAAEQPKVALPKPAAPRPAAEPPKMPAPKTSKPRELAKKEAAPDPRLELSQPAQTPAPAPPPPQAAAGAAPQKKAQTQSYGTPQVTTSPPPSSINVQNEGYQQRYRNAPQLQPQSPPAANTESTAELDETRQQTQGLVSQSRREQQKQAAAPPEQLYSQLVTSTNNGNDCAKVMDLVKQLETWNFWSTQHPNEMRNAYLLRGRCQLDNKLADKDMENARRIANEQEKNEKVRASKAGKKAAPSKSKASDNAASAPAEAAPAPAKK